MLLKTLLLFTLFLPHCQPAFLPFTFFNTVGINPFIKIRWKDTCPGCPGPGVEITFIQTGEIDVACLTLDSECVYKGYFRKEPDIPVTVTRGCPNQDADFIEATFKSYKVQGITFMSQVSNGDTVNPLVATAGQFIADHSDEAPGGGRLRTFDNSSIFARQLAFPTYGFEMDIVIYYDNNYKNNLHSGSDSAAKAQIDAVMAHVQTYFNLADSLGTTIKINVKRTEHLSQDWTATEANLKSLENYADALPASDDSIDAFVLFSYENNMAGTTGIAYLGTTCETPRGGRVSISEWTASNIVTAQTVAHEVAHNLKIDHDFNEDSSGVRDPSNPKTCSIEAAPNNVCTNVNSIMDYDQVSNKSQLKIQATKRDDS